MVLSPPISFVLIEGENEKPSCGDIPPNASFLGIELKGEYGQSEYYVNGGSIFGIFHSTAESLSKCTAVSLTWCW